MLIYLPSSFCVACGGYEEFEMMFLAVKNYFLYYKYIPNWHTMVISQESPEKMALCSFQAKLK